MSFLPSIATRKDLTKAFEEIHPSVYEIATRRSAMDLPREVSYDFCAVTCRSKARTRRRFEAETLARRQQH